jgi:hypothetical protein
MALWMDVSLFWIPCSLERSNEECVDINLVNEIEYILIDKIEYAVF